MFEHAPWHPGINLAGRTVTWMPTDTQESFERMIQDPGHREYFAQQGWLEPDAITYNINSQGFRCDEFEPGQPCMIALGCSYTMGIGLPSTSVWPTILGNRLGLKVYNLAWGGASSDTCFRLAQYWIPLLKPKLVAMLAPPKTRIELLMDQGCHPPAEVFMPSSESVYLCDDFVNDIFLKHWWLNDENGRINNLKNNLAIEQLANRQQAKFTYLLADQEMARSREEVGYARDYMHAGPRGHHMVVEKMLRSIEWP